MGSVTRLGTNYSPWSKRIPAFWLGTLLAFVLGVVSAWYYTNNIGTAFRNGLAFDPLWFMGGGMLGGLIGLGIGYLLFRDAENNMKHWKYAPFYFRQMSAFSHSFFPTFLATGFGAIYATAHWNFGQAFPFLHF